MNKKEEILEIASKAFREYGFQKANLTYIAEQCGMNKAGLYYYFKNKENLFMSMLQKDIASLQDKLTSILSEPGDLNQRLRSFMIYRTSSIGLIKKYLEMFSQGTAPPRLRDYAITVKQKFNIYEINLLTDFLTEWVEYYGLTRVKPHFLTLLLTGVSEKIGLMKFHDNYDIEIDKTIEEILDLFLSGYSIKKEEC